MNNLHRCGTYLSFDYGLTAIVDVVVPKLHTKLKGSHLREVQFPRFNNIV